MPKSQLATSRLTLAYADPKTGIRDISPNLLHQPKQQLFESTRTTRCDRSTSTLPLNYGDQNVSEGH